MLHCVLSLYSGESADTSGIILTTQSDTGEDTPNYNITVILHTDTDALDIVSTA